MAVTKEAGAVGQAVENAIDSQRDWLDPLGERIQGWLSAALEQGGPSARKVKDFLNGTWLGHSLHPALSDAPVGAWLTGAVLDLVGAEDGADAALTLGVIAAVPTAAAGVADWHDQAGKARRTGLVHAMLNSAGLTCFIASLIARRKNDRALGVGLSTAGLALAIGGAYLGGELVFTQGTSVDRNAWDPESEGWQVAASAPDLVEGQLTKGEIEAEGKKLPLVLLKKGHRVLALGGVCSHMGGPLPEGELVDGESVKCPWHGSTFDMQDGRIVHGPSAYPQPAYEARQRNGNVEVRLKR
jgi:nitrite reductase/ring-hydroxylating ferredoxin subunit